MSSRYTRPASPPGRRYDNYGRSSTGQLAQSYDMPSRYSHRDSFTSPRGSAERVIPVSAETYVNGTLVDSRSNRAVHDAYKDRPRRSTYDMPPFSSSSSLRAPGSSSADDRGISPTSKSSAYDSAYGSSASYGSNGRREHKKVYSIDDERRSSRLVPEPDRKRRDDTDSARQPAPLAGPGRSREYHRNAPLTRSTDDYGYEYADARGALREPEQKWRSRHGSFDTNKKERPTSMVEPYSVAPRMSARDFAAPPPATRGLERIAGGVSRHESLRERPRSPPRHRDRAYSNYSEDDNYPVKPRVSTSRADPAYYPPDRHEAYSPTREDYDDRRESRAMSRRWEDPEIVTRGFGIRTSSADEYDTRSASMDRRPTYAIEAPPAQSRREYPSDSSRDEYREPEWRERDREPARAKERDILRGSEKDLPTRDRDLPPVERDVLPVDREYLPRDREMGSKDYEKHSKEAYLTPRDRDVPRDRDISPRDEAGPARERDLPSRKKEPTSSDQDLPKNRPLDIPYDDTRRARDKGYGRDREERYLDEERLSRSGRDHADDKDEKGSHAGSNVSASMAVPAVAGTAAAGAAAYGAKELYDRRHRDDYDDRSDRGEREVRPSRRDEERRKIDRAQPERGPEDKERSRKITESPEGERPRARNYVGREDKIDEIDRQGAENKYKHSEILDPDEEYRRRVQREADKVRQPKHEESRRDEDVARERRRREREDKPSRGREEVPLPGGHGSDDYDVESDRGDESKALAPVEKQRDSVLEESSSYDPYDSSERARENRVRIVEPAKDDRPVKSILRKPTEKFPEDPNPIREGVAPLKDAKNKDKSIPTNARWTKIARALVNPETLDEMHERYEEFEDHVIILRVVTKEEIQKFAERTKEIRGKRRHSQAFGAQRGKDLVEYIMPFICNILTSYLQQDERYERHHRDGRSSRKDGERDRRDYDGNEDSDRDRGSKQISWDR